MSSARGSRSSEISHQFERLLRTLSPGAALPSLRTLATQWSVPRYGVDRVAAELIARGTLIRRKYKLFVASAKTQRDESPVGARCLILVAYQREAEVAEQIAQRFQLDPIVDVWDFTEADIGKIAPVQDHAIPALIAHGVSPRLAPQLATLRDRGVTVVVGRTRLDGFCCVRGDAGREVQLGLRALERNGHRHVALCVDAGFNADAIRAFHDEAAALRLASAPLWLLRHHFLLPLLALPENQQPLDQIRATLRAREVTAILVGPAVAPHLESELSACRRSVPCDVSLILLGENQPHRSWVGVPFADEMRACCEVLVTMRHPAARALGPAPARDILIEPQWSPGPTVRSVSGAFWPEDGANRSLRHFTPRTLDIRWSADPADRRAEVRRLNEEPFPGLAGPEQGVFETLSLGPYFNRSKRRNAWLGDRALLHLTAGRRLIHGIPFELADESAHAGHSAIVLRSAFCVTSHDAALPSAISIPLGRWVRDMFVLHACAHVKGPEPFGAYHFDWADGRSHTVPIRPLAWNKDSYSIQNAVIQDWWPGFDVLRNAHTHAFVVTEHGDPWSYERYLYTYRWSNTRPEQPVAQLRVVTDPSRPETLALLAITLHI